MKEPPPETPLSVRLRFRPAGSTGTGLADTPARIGGKRSRQKQRAWLLFLKRWNKRAIRRQAEVAPVEDLPVHRTFCISGLGEGVKQKKEKKERQLALVGDGREISHE
ncbi:unnamed protein product [Boreogadus saida]